MKIKISNSMDHPEVSYNRVPYVLLATARLTQLVLSGA